MHDDQTLNFPAHIAEQIGLSAHEISWLRKSGCPFHGRKTSVRWVRLYLDKISGAEKLIYGNEFPECPLAKALSFQHSPGAAAPSLTDAVATKQNRHRKSSRSRAEGSTI
jgi:hypothetical protein